MFDKTEKHNNKQETIQEIAIKLVEEQLQLLTAENGPKERTVFVLGSKSVGKSSVINRFFEREENTRPTLALEYFYGRRTSPAKSIQKQVLNVWELGSLQNSEKLMEVPLRSHGIIGFAAIIMIDLSQPNRVWSDLEKAYMGLKNICSKMLSEKEQAVHRAHAMERIKKDHVDMQSLDLMPFPIVIVGGKYDIFMDFDPALKKHICRSFRSMAHLIGASLLFYSNKIPKLAKTLRDTFSHFGFGSPSQPFRLFNTDYNDALSIWFGSDSWERIGSHIANVEHIGTTLDMDVPQLTSENGSLPEDPAKDAGFRESIIDEMRAQKDEELNSIIRESQLRGQFESVRI